MKEEFDEKAWLKNIRKIEKNKIIDDDYTRTPRKKQKEYEPIFVSSPNEVFYNDHVRLTTNEKSELKGVMCGQLGDYHARNFKRSGGHNKKRLVATSRTGFDLLYNSAEELASELPISLSTITRCLKYHKAIEYGKMKGWRVREYKEGKRLHTLTHKEIYEV